MKNFKKIMLTTSLILTASTCFADYRFNKDMKPQGLDKRIAFSAVAAPPSDVYQINGTGEMVPASNPIFYASYTFTGTGTVVGEDFNYSMVKDISSSGMEAQITLSGTFNANSRIGSRTISSCTGAALLCGGVAIGVVDNYNQDNLQTTGGVVLNSIDGVDSFVFGELNLVTLIDSSSGTYTDQITAVKN